MSKVPGFMTIREVKKEIHMSESTVRLLIWEGKIRAVKQGKVTRVPVEEVHRWRGLLAAGMMDTAREGQRPPSKMGALAKAIGGSP